MSKEGSMTLNELIKVYRMKNGTFPSPEYLESELRAIVAKNALGLCKDASNQQ